MGLIYLPLQEPRVRIAQRLKKPRFASVDLPLGWHPYASYYFVQRRGGREWHAYTSDKNKRWNTVYTGHFATVPEGYVELDAVVYDDSQPLHICTVGAIDPRTSDAITTLEGGAMGTFEYPEYKVAVLESDIKAKPIGEIKKPHIYVQFDSKSTQSEYFAWCIRNGKQPVYRTHGALNSIWDVDWRIDYESLKIDSDTLEKLHYVECDGGYYPIDNRYQAPKMALLPEGHILKDFINPPYEKLSELIRTMRKADTYADIKISAGYTFAAGVMMINGYAQRFAISDYGQYWDHRIEIPATPESVQRVYQSRVAQFNTRGNLLVAGDDLHKLGLTETLETTNNAGTPVVILPQEDPKWKDVDSKFLRKYAADTVCAYRIHKGDKTATEATRVYDTTKTRKPKETTSERATRLKAVEYSKEIQLHRWGDADILHYVKLSKSDAYLKLLRKGDFLDNLDWVYQKPDAEGMKYLGWVYRVEATFESTGVILEESGAGERCCGVIFVKKEYATLSSALENISGLKPQSTLYRFLTTIIQACSALGSDGLKRLLMAQI